MARGGRGGGGGMGNMQQMMAQAQRMQAQMEEKQKELEGTEYTASAGGGVVEATVTGAKQVIGLKINPEVVDPEDVEMLEDLVTAALNEAIAQADAAMSEEMGKITQGLGIRMP